MQLEDFAFIYQGKIVRALHENEASYLLPIDQCITQKRDHALLMLHGFASSPAVYRAMLPHIRGYDRVVCPVLPGHADSIQAFSQCTIQDWRSAAQKHCQVLVEAYKHVTVLGLSLGALLALELSQLWPLHHLYLLAPAFKLYFSLPLAIFTARLLLKLGFKALPNYGGNFYDSQYYELSYRQLPLTTIIEILSLIKDFPNIQPTCPTDIFLAKHDKVINSQAVARNIELQKNTSLHWLERSAHIIPLDGDIELLSNLISI